MKKIPALIVLVLFYLGSFGQTTRYFQFHTDCGNGIIWQDTSFVAATADTSVIDSVVADLAKPEMQRRMISGKITYGDGGYNHNASHWFLWHYNEDQWHLAEISVEVCDGCPYRDVDADTAYWIGQLGIFCPWSSHVMKELTDPATINSFLKEPRISVYPNPVTSILCIKADRRVNVELMSIEGKILLKKEHAESINISGLALGTYMLRIDDENGILIKVEKLVKE